MAAEASEARAVLHEFTREGRLSPGSSERAEWGTWDRVAPGWVLLLGLKSLVLFRWEEGRTGPELLPDVPAGMSRNEADNLIEMLRGSLSAAEVARTTGGLTLERVLALLVCVIADEAMTHQEVDTLLELAVAMNEEVLQSGDLSRPLYRGTDIGPWDVSETDWEAMGLLDLGGLKVPRKDVRKVEVNPLRSDTEELAEVVLFRGTTASLQLQAFRTSGEPEWGTICDRLEVDLRARGAEVERWSGREGVELRAVVPVAGDTRGRDRMTVRFIGCDGPGWLLRGVIGGAVALPDSSDDWAYGSFEGVVVDPAFVVPRAVPAWPAVGDLLASTEQSRVIPLRFPE
ncbi:uncharacterized protein DUF3710 [Streptomyces sp. CG 926]|uniref:DUF3710 domain-containing protein n=1 Tax=Streptomyces sp. CG 926 TaxID=1882405 RepID=UPI000D7B5D72|nr:DUF3710 domain-containing protein [Streptomyces sp. CG 926]PWK74857.1 uncharacterized protein DUF3710 [Streptomyces sp. CG 926]